MCDLGTLQIMFQAHLRVHLTHLCQPKISSPRLRYRLSTAHRTQQTGDPLLVGQFGVCGSDSKAVSSQALPKREIPLLETHSEADAAAPLRYPAAMSSPVSHDPGLDSKGSTLVIRGLRF